MKAYKGFTKEMKCRNFQYEEGGEYEQSGEIKCCENGFHACEAPLDCFNYYSPADSVYHEVELGGKISKEEKRRDTKVAASKIKIGAELNFLGLAKAHVEWVKENIKKDNNQSNTGNYSAATNTGYQSAATNTGDQSAATNTGNYSAATNTGYQSAATNTGDQSAATNTGNYSAATNTGYQSAATNTGYRSAATNTGYQSAATNTGYQSAATVVGANSVALAWGIESKAKASLGSYIVLSEWEETEEGYTLKSAKMAKVDGKKIKPDTFYMLKDGKFVEVE